MLPHSVLHLPLSFFLAVPSPKTLWIPLIFKMSNVISLQVVYSDKIHRQILSCLCESKAKFPILEALAYFISWVHPHYGGRLRNLRIPSLWCVCCMQFMSNRRAKEDSESKRKQLVFFFLPACSNHKIAVIDPHITAVVLQSYLHWIRGCRRMQGILNPAYSGHVTQLRYVGVAVQW